MPPHGQWFVGWDNRTFPTTATSRGKTAFNLYSLYRCHLTLDDVAAAYHFAVSVGLTVLYRFILDWHCFNYRRGWFYWFGACGIPRRPTTVITYHATYHRLFTIFGLYYHCLMDTRRLYLLHVSP